jgi:hypothetical protein
LMVAVRVVSISKSRSKSSGFVPAHSACHCRRSASGFSSPTEYAARQALPNAACVG